MIKPTNGWRHHHDCRVSDPVLLHVFVPGVGAGAIVALAAGVANMYEFHLSAGSSTHLSKLKIFNWKRPAIMGLHPEFTSLKTRPRRPRPVNAEQR